MKKRFPETLKYLTAYYDELKPRQVDVTGVRDVPGATKDTWYQYGRDQGLTAFNNKKKIIVGILSKNPLYLYDENNLVIASGGTAGYCGIESKVNSQYSLEYLQAYLAHPRTDYILSLMASDFEGDYYARGTNVLNRIPIKILDFTNPSQKALHDEIVVKAQMVYQFNAVIDMANTLSSMRGEGEEFSFEQDKMNVSIIIKVKFFIVFILNYSSNIVFLILWQCYGSFL